MLHRLNQGFDAARQDEGSSNLALDGAGPGSSLPGSGTPASVPAGRAGGDGGNGHTAAKTSKRRLREDAGEDSPGPHRSKYR